MRIEGENFVLRPERAGDAPAVAQAFADDPNLAVDWGIDEAPDEKTAHEWLAEHAAQWEAGEGRQFAVADPGTDVLIGGVNFHRIEPGTAAPRSASGSRRAPAAAASVPRVLTPRAAGRSSAGTLVRIEMTTLPDNEASLALAAQDRLPARGLLRSRNFERGEQVDIVMLSLLASEL